MVGIEEQEGQDSANIIYPFMADTEVFFLSTSQMLSHEGVTS